MMLTHGGTEADASLRQATVTLTAALYGREPEELTFSEIAELERDAFGRVLVFTRFSAGADSGQLLLIFTSVEPDGTFCAGPKCYLEVRDCAFYAGIEHHKIRNSWNCPIDAVPEF